MDNIEKILGGDLENISIDIKDKYIKKLKFIPFSSLGRQNGMLVGIKPTYVEIIDEQDILKKEDVIVGIYENSFTKDGKYLLRENLSDVYDKLDNKWFYQPRRECIVNLKNVKKLQNNI